MKTLHSRYCVVCES